MRKLLTATLLPVLALAALTIAPLGAQSGGGCPHQGASFVPGASTVLPPWRICYMKLNVLGVTITLAGKRCPTGHTRVASHTECLGAFAEGMRCAEGGLVPIELELCSCVPQGKGGSWISTCECRSAGALGFTEAGLTTSCN